MRIRPDRRELNANGRVLIANPIRVSVMILEWLKRSMRSRVFPTMTYFGESNGSPELAITGVSRANISVGLLPYVAIASVWRHRRPVVMDLAECRRRLQIDTSSCRMLALADLTVSGNVIPRSSYLFGVSWPDVRRTLVVAVEKDGDPFATLVPTAEIIRFYYAPSTRLAQALFWGEYSESFNAALLEKAW